MTARTVPHEITLLAFSTNEDGTLTVYDYIDTSFHHASFFARQWYRDEKVTHMVARPPANMWFDRKPRPIVR